MSSILKLTFSFILAFLILLTLFKPAISTTRSGGLVFLTNVGSFYIPSLTSMDVFVFPKTDSHLEKIVEKNIQNSKAQFGVYIKNTTTGQEYSLNKAERFKTASVYKIMLAATVLNWVKEGQLKLDENVYQKLERSITVSNNEDSWHLANIVGWKTIEKEMNKLGLKNTTMNVPPISTPEDIKHFLELLLNGKVVNENYDDMLLNFMFSQRINDRIPKYLPKETSVAHKTGEFEDVRHDVGVVSTNNNDFIIVLMSKEIGNEGEVKETMAKISKEVYEYFENQWSNPPQIL